MPIQTAIDSISNSQGSPFGFKNRIINGGMVIDQRNAGASVTPTTTVYTVDRWSPQVSQSSKLSFQQVSDAPTGFSYSFKATSLSSYSVTSGDYFILRQHIEGYNAADLNFGSSTASTVTLSFWVKSSLTGNFSVSIYNSDGSRNYPVSYTINSVNTWEYKTITISGSTTGTWYKDNNIGISLGFGLGAGSTFSAASGTWNSGSWTPQATSTVSVVGTNTATWQVTGVQLEKGTQATSFDYRPYGTELQLCQRYYEQVAGFSGFFSNNSAHLRANLKVPKRTQSVAISYSNSPMTVLAANNADAAGTTSTSGGIDQRLVAFNTDSAHIRLLNMSGTGVTNGFGCILTDSQYCIFDAEI
jgi:hypothetical protein